MVEFVGYIIFAGQPKVRSVMLFGVINILFSCTPCLFTSETMIERGDNTRPVVVLSELSEAVKE